MGYANVFDFYEAGQTLGKGQFGLVRLATHKRTKAQVAIKVVKKANMKTIEIYQQRREIEVLKMCQHKGIIKLVDVFENSDYYYIVLEYLTGKDMFDYIQRRNF
jgi:serine/threonine protein kinase